MFRRDPISHFISHFPIQTGPAAEPKVVTNQVAGAAVRPGAIKIKTAAMRITEDVRKFAAEQKIPEEQALQVGLEQKAKDSAERGAEVYAKT
jgi:hypothetical protein